MGDLDDAARSNGCAETCASREGRHGRRRQPRHPVPWARPPHRPFIHGARRADLKAIVETFKALPAAAGVRRRHAGAQLESSQAPASLRPRRASSSRTAGTTQCRRQAAWLTMRNNDLYTLGDTAFVHRYWTHSAPGKCAASVDGAGRLHIEPRLRRRAAATPRGTSSSRRQWSWFMLWGRLAWAAMFDGAVRPALRDGAASRAPKDCSMPHCRRSPDPAATSTASTGATSTSCRTPRRRRASQLRRRAQLRRANVPAAVRRTRTASRCASCR